MPIQLFKPFYRTDEILSSIRECFDIGWTGLGFKTIEFEKAWCDYTGLPHAHFVNSGTAGLHLAIRLLKEQNHWKDGDEIITTPLTFVSTNHAILYERLNPVFADVDHYLCLDPESVAARITNKTRAVMFVGMGGNTGQIQKITEICQSHNLKLIIDGAHMAGTRIDGQHIGHDADAIVFSFHTVKNLPTADSGMICFRDDDLDAKVRHWTWLGINKDTYTRTQKQSSYQWMYDVENVGFKYHGNSIMASIGLVSLKYLDQDNAYRQQIATWYDQQFAQSKNIRTICIPVGCESSRHLYQILVDNRDEVIMALNRYEIYPGVHYHDNTQYSMYAYADGTCPMVRYYSDHLISLPIHIRLTHHDVVHIGTILNEIS